jgi:hypothetical protein
MSTYMHITGQCHCGAISFSATADPSRVIACHCTDCQIFSGAPFRAVLPVPAGDLTLSGKPQHYVKVAASGNRRAQAFCGACGTNLYATDPDTLEIYSLRLGCINERGQLQPSVQIWVDSSMPWLPKLSEVRSHVAGTGSNETTSPTVEGASPAACPAFLENQF